MNLKNLSALAILSPLILHVNAAEEPKEVQVVERERPAEWAGLVHGGRFMDRILPMPDLGGMTSETWGADNVIPREVNNGIEDPKWSYWGGNVRLEKDGKYHLLVCRWPEDSPKGHMEWPRSIVVHAISNTPFGPFKVHDEIGPGHNPEWYIAKDGTYVLYVIGARYTAKSINGPWTKSEFVYNSRERKDTKQGHYLSNCTFAQREDGSFFMVNRHGEAWFGKDGLSDWNRVSDDRFYPPIEAKFEDPVIWRTDFQYHLIVNDWLGRIAWCMRSKNGVDWVTDPGEAYAPGVSINEDGTDEGWFKYERPKVMQDEHGRATVLGMAVIDTLKHDDLPNDKHSSKWIAMPLTVERLISVQNAENITAETETITLKVQAEPGFDPHTDMDLASLRFGAPAEVNYGRGAKFLSSEKSGPDLVLTFEGKGNGFIAEDFAGKLLGKTSAGKLLLGWSRLPGVTYIEPILSSLTPIITREGDALIANVAVSNFGQVASKESAIELVTTENGTRTTLAKGVVPVLEPFAEIIVKLQITSPVKEGSTPEVTTIISGAGLKPVTFTRPISVPEIP